MKQPKLLHVTSSLAVGGAEKLLYMLVKQLQLCAYKQTVLYIHPGPFVAEIEKLGIKTCQIKGRWCLYDPFFFWHLFKAIKQEQPDLVHSLLWSANVSVRLCAIFLNISVVSAYHNNVDQDGYVRSLLDQLTINRATHLVAVSDQVKDSMQARSWGVARPITVITNGIELIDQRNTIKMVTRDEFDITQDAFVIGAVGRFVPVKRFEYVIRTYAHMDMRNSYLVIVGSGPLEEHLKSVVRACDIEDHVRFVTNAIALHYYPLFNCFVQSSCKEGVSLALLEAMQCAKPCIVMGQEGQHPVITHKYDGIVVDPYDQQALIDELIYLKQHKSYGIELARAAGQTVKRRYALHVMVDEYKKLFEMVLYREGIRS